jgi:RHS repeat-associated protein
MYTLSLALVQKVGPVTGEALSGITVTAQNRISNGSTYYYDTAGNMMTISGVAYNYDAENHLTSTAGVTYTYDGDGIRIVRSNGTIDWLGVDGSVLDRTDLTGSVTNGNFHEFFFLNGQRIARRDSANNVIYYVPDHLGTTRVIAQVNSGSNTATLCYDADFYPFGGERPYTNNCSQSYKFTGKERDSESNLDHFDARHYGSAIGRFMSPDPMGNYYADGSNPQSWNMYAYVRNDPLSFRDPTGLDCVYLNDAGTAVESVDRNSNGDECSSHGGTWLSWPVNDPKQVVVDPDSNWVGYHIGPNTMAIGCNASTGDCGVDAKSAFLGSSVAETVYVTARPDTNGLAYFEVGPTPLVETAVSAYVPPFQITMRPPTKLEKVLSAPGCLGNAALAPDSSHGSSDVPEGHMGGQTNLQPSSGPLISPSGPSTFNTGLGGVQTINTTASCLNAIK